MRPSGSLHLAALPEAGCQERACPLLCASGRGEVGSDPPASRLPDFLRAQRVAFELL